MMTFFQTAFTSQTLVKHTMAEESTASSVFISYGREIDVTYFVRQLKRDLEANGFSVWLDLEKYPFR